MADQLNKVVVTKQKVAAVIDVECKWLDHRESQGCGMQTSNAQLTMNEDWWNTKAGANEGSGDSCDRWNRDQVWKGVAGWLEKRWVLRADWETETDWWLRGNAKEQNKHKINIR